MSKVKRHGPSAAGMDREVSIVILCREEVSPPPPLSSPSLELSVVDPSRPFRCVDMDVSVRAERYWQGFNDVLAANKISEDVRNPEVQAFLREEVISRLEEDVQMKWKRDRRKLYNQANKKKKKKNGSQKGGGGKRRLQRGEDEEDKESDASDSDSDEGGEASKEVHGKGKRGKGGGGIDSRLELNIPSSLSRGISEQEAKTMTPKEWASRLRNMSQPKLRAFRNLVGHIAVERHKDWLSKNLIKEKMMSLEQLASLVSLDSSPDLPEHTVPSRGSSIESSPGLSPTDEPGKGFHGTSDLSHRIYEDTLGFFRLHVVQVAEDVMVTEKFEQVSTTKNRNQPYSMLGELYSAYEYVLMLASPVGLLGLQDGRVVLDGIDPMIKFVNIYRGLLLLSSSAADSTKRAVIQSVRLLPGSSPRVDDIRSISFEDMTLHQLNTRWDQVVNLAKSIVPWDASVLYTNGVWIRALTGYKNPDRTTLQRAHQRLNKWLILCSNKAYPESSRMGFKKGLVAILKSAASSIIYGDLTKRCLAIREDICLATPFDKWLAFEKVLRPESGLLPEHLRELRVLLNKYVKCREATEEDAEERKARVKNHVPNRCRHSKDSLVEGACSCSSRGRKGLAPSRSGSCSDLPSEEPGRLSRQGSSVDAGSDGNGGGGAGWSGGSRRNQSRSRLDFWDLQDEVRREDLRSMAPPLPPVPHHGVRLSSSPPSQPEDQIQQQPPPPPTREDSGSRSGRRRSLSALPPTHMVDRNAAQQQQQEEEYSFNYQDGPAGEELEEEDQDESEEDESDDEEDYGNEEEEEEDPFSWEDEHGWEMEQADDDLGPLASDEELEDDDVQLYLHRLAETEDATNKAPTSMSDLDASAFQTPVEGQDPWQLPDPYRFGECRDQLDQDLLPSLVVVRRSSSRSSDGVSRGRSWESPRLKPSIQLDHNNLQAHQEQVGGSKVTPPVVPEPVEPPPFPLSLEGPERLSRERSTASDVSSYLARDTSLLLVMDDAYFKEEEHMLNAMFDHLEGSGGKGNP